MSLFSTTGIRGISNELITPEFAVKLGRTFGTYLGGEGTVLVGMDSRTSSVALKNAIISGLISTGIHVIDAGLVPITAIGYTVKNKHYNAGIMVTSSHNPPEYNGFKFILDNGLEITADAEDKFEEIFNKGDFIKKKWDEIGEYSTTEILNDYINALKTFFDSKAISKRRLKVVLDTCNGAQSVLMPKLLEDLGCNVVAINTETKGIFNRTPEPTPKTLGDLQDIIKKENADLGIGFDIDGDRSIFVTEKAEVLMGDIHGSLISREFLRENKNSTIVTTVSTSKIIDDVVVKENGTLIKTEVGGKHVAAKLLDKKAVFGFEENGGCIFTDFNLTRDGTATTVKILEIISKNGKTFSEVVAELPKYYQRKGNVGCSAENVGNIMEKIEKTLKDQHYKELIDIDGVKVIYEDASLLIRPSGTEPIIRFYTEALTEERVKELEKYAYSLIRASV